MSRDELRRYRRGWLKVPGSSSSGSIGRPTLATPREGRRDLRPHPREGPRRRSSSRPSRTTSRSACGPGAIYCVTSPRTSVAAQLDETPCPTRRVRAGDPLSQDLSPDAYSAVRRAHRRAARAGRAGTDSYGSGAEPPVVVTLDDQAPLLTLDDAIALARRNNPVYLSQANARRTADAAVRIGEGRAAALRRRELRQRAISRAASRCSTACRSATAPTPSSRAMGSNLNYRVNSATFVHAEGGASRTATRSMPTSPARPSSSRRGHAAVPERAPGAGALRAAGHARARRRRRSSSWRRPSSRSARARRSTSAAPRWRSARRRSRCSRRATTSRSRSFASSSRWASPQPANVSADDRFPGDPAELLARLAARRWRGGRTRPSSRCARASAPPALNVKVAKAAYTPTLNLSTGWGGNSYQYTNGEFLVNQARGGALGQHGRLLLSRTRSARASGCRRTTAALAYQPSRTPRRRRSASGTSQFPFKFQRSPLALSAQLSIPMFDNFNREERVQQAPGRARRRRVQREGEGARS